MSVLFHIATRADWERANLTGAYVPDSLLNDGYVLCSTAEQHAAVANALFAGRRDLVLLLIDASRLTSEIRLEGADQAGRAFPHVYGQLDLEAVFEAAPYPAGADGQFRTHEEASGFTTTGVATLEETRDRALSAMTGFAAPLWIAGGWALDLFLDRKTRPHADLEISILGSDQRALFEHLRGWDLRLAAPEHTLSLWNGGLIEPPFHQVWARTGPGRRESPEVFGADPTMLDFLIEQEREGRWAFRRHPAITRARRVRDFVSQRRSDRSVGSCAPLQGEVHEVQGPARHRRRAPQPRRRRSCVARLRLGRGPPRPFMACAAVTCYGFSSRTRGSA